MAWTKTSFAPSVDRGVDESVQMRLQRMHAAVGEQAGEVNRAAVLHRVDERRIRFELVPRDRPCRCGRCPDRRCVPRRCSDARPRSCPSGRRGKPTARPEASSVVHGDSRNSRSKRGVSASAIAFDSRLFAAAEAVEDDEDEERAVGHCGAASDVGVGCRRIASGCDFRLRSRGATISNAVRSTRLPTPHSPKLLHFRPSVQHSGGADP